MAEVILTSPEVIVYPGGGTSPASVVGAPPVWTDESDATYARTSANNSLGSQYVGGTLDTHEAAGVSLVTMTTRVMADASNTGSDANRAHFHWFAGEADLGATTLDLGTLGAIESHSTVVSADDFDEESGGLSGFLAAIAAGTASVRVLAGSPEGLGSTNTVTVYEFGLVLTIDEALGKPFRRVWPREHGRVWPPPRHQHGRRTHGGYL